MTPYGIMISTIAAVTFACAALWGYSAEYAEPLRPDPISFTCGAYDVTFRPHDSASRDDVFQMMAGRECTLVANPDFHA